MMFVSFCSNATGVTCGIGSANPSGASQFSPGFYWCTCYSILSFLCSVLQIIVCCQWCTCYLILSFLCSVLLTIVCFQWCTCYSILSFLCSVLLTIVCCQWCTCYSIFSFLFSVLYIIVFSGVRVTQSLVFCVVFCRSLFCPPLVIVLQTFLIFQNVKPKPISAMLVLSMTQKVGSAWWLMRVLVVNQ